MFDLVVKHANLPDGRRDQDIACENARIVAIEPNIQGSSRHFIDAEGHLVSPPFIDGHLHLDAALLHERPLANETGGLYEGIAIWAKAKQSQTIDEYKARAREVCRWAIAQGTLHIRCQTDICEPELRGVRALIELREEFSLFINLQIVAFPQDGYFRFPGAQRLMEEAIELGAEVVGGIPDYELTTAEGNESIRELCGIAQRKGLMVDMHMDQTTDPQSRQIEMLSSETIRLGIGPKVTASHCPTISSVNQYYARKLIDQMAQSGMSVMVQPMQAATCWGIMAPIARLFEAGVNVALGQDCILDPWYPYGKCDMLDIAHMASVFGQVLASKRKLQLFDAITTSSARALGLQDYGLEKGRAADFVLLQARDPVEAIRLRPPRLAVVRGGRVIASQPKQEVTLKLDQKEQLVRFERQDAANVLRAVDARA